LHVYVLVHVATRISRVGNDSLVIASRIGPSASTVLGVECRLARTGLLDRAAAAAGGWPVQLQLA
jgi:hypothetical protein